MNKWTEREFWAALLPAVAGLLSVLGVIGADDNPLVQAITGVALIGGPAMAYIVMRIWQKISLDRSAALVKVEQAKSEARGKEADSLVAVAAAEAGAKAEVAKSEAKAAIAIAASPPTP